MANFLGFFSDSTGGNPLLGSGLRLSGDISRDMYDNDIPETDEGKVFLALAYTACSISNTSISWGLKTWDDISITSKFPRRFTPEMAGEPPEIARGADHMNGDTPTWIPGNGTEKDYGLYKTGNIDLCPDPDDRVTYKTIVGGASDWKQFYIDFLNAYQTSGLTQGHVSSYMKWLKVEGVDGEYISKNFGKLAGGAPIVSDNEKYRELLRKGKWTDYRSSFATIVGVIKRMLDELPKEYHVLFTTETRKKIQAAVDNTHSEETFRKIPEMVLAYAYVWNIVTKLDLDGLWSGKRAYESLSYSHKQSMMNVMKEAQSKIKVWDGGILKGLNDLPEALRNA